jgi:hypothetical protein
MEGSIFDVVVTIRPKAIEGRKRAYDRGEEKLPWFELLLNLPETIMLTRSEFVPPEIVFHPRRIGSEPAVRCRN